MTTPQTTTAAPALYTPDDHLFTDPASTAKEQNNYSNLPEDEFTQVYEIDSTVKQILEKGYRRIALQFPDELLGDSTKVYELISKGINEGVADPRKSTEVKATAAPEKEEPQNGCCGQKSDGCCGGSGKGSENACAPKESQSGCCKNSGSVKTPDGTSGERKKVFILADTSYSACCIDEVAAEHCSADVVVHYGRSCLSPTTRLPVIYVFTTRPLALPQVVSSFTATFPDRASPVILMADVTYTAHIPALHTALLAEGYTHLFATDIVHDPSSPLPNRTHPPPEQMRESTLFHIAEPLPSLLLVLASRVAQIHTYTPNTTAAAATTPTSTALLLRRRYALLSHARTATIIGILINTLNVRNYLPMITHTKAAIAAAGRKPYLVVVGKVNVAKIANFDEIQVWVGIGCWEQGIVGSAAGREFYRPVVTPFELGIALDRSRVWGGEWIVDFETLLSAPVKPEEEEEEGSDEDDEDDEAPEFDLRTGRYVAAARAPRKRKGKKTPGEPRAGALIRNDDGRKQVLAGGVVSPAAEFLRDKRSWRGLGSDFVVEYEKEEGAKEEKKGAIVEVGRSGVARGYTVGGGERH
ncbi:diphthamide biosynthesis protein [Morchella conica CCBAS932]|uniref:2-(3-amino-3-carboxypropyl)histidine synthase subunit 2 n=1 Tax=Morchella conica CCBAS932 TaxID=1392247 RepID=A0A3N4L078_9PEZI|nr:diphthamide biosynthesis protein [Morchella conica CCBAS932]